MRVHSGRAARASIDGCSTSRRRCCRDHNIDADLRLVWRELQLDELHVLDGRRVEGEERKVVHRVRVGDGERHLFIVAEYRLGDDGTGTRDVPIRHDEAALLVDDEAGRLHRAR